LALNRISGEFDEEMLSVLLQEMDEADRNLSGFDEKEIEKALNAALTVEEDDYNLEPPKESKTKLGDIYQLGGYVNCPECNEKLELGKQCLR
jgi:transcription initiation factor IIE alpha subunit